MNPDEESVFKIFSKLNKMKMEEEKCKHLEIIEENNFLICLDCGEQLERKINHGFCFSDQFRVGQRNEYQRNIFNDVKHMNFSLNIIEEGNSIYEYVTDGKILRGESRKDVIFACIYYAFKMSNNYQIPEEFISIFRMEKKKCLKGLKYVNQRMKKNPENDGLQQTKKYIKQMMNIFSATPSNEEEILSLWKKLQNKSSGLNRVRPQSVIASLIYYSILKRPNNNMTLKQFSKKVKLSENTIKKNIKDISNILEE